MAAETSFDIGIETGDGHTLVTVSGEVDVFTSPRLRQVLFDPVLCAQPRTVVDLHAVTFMDSTGVGTLVAARRWATSREQTIALVCSAGPALRLLGLVGLDKVFEVHETVEAAVAP
ncbi:STAS domain-containing protein [Nocardioides mangrovi]|uniref:Anti-sigma factor antagonist n=1 Tax=Nocardioides mangrovi TaxID=2874580 RepID=A0ABS7UA17_9ACTN|nr:STAS domain-containing protein [Nocardioides mangrovi]MBZ5737571.1 STAS domain-containing protein [Nocardioides mangrovi]